MVYGAVNRHGGSLDIRSAPGTGTTFRIDLPASDAAAPVIATLVRPARPLSILVVDDHPVYRDLLQQVSTAEWHRVEAAPNARAALARLSRRAFDVVITDFTMPGMDGARLAARVKASAPQTRVILLTGFDPGQGTVVESLSAVDLRLSKPG